MPIGSFTGGLIALLLFEFLLDSLAEGLNLGRLDSPLPEEFRSLLDEEKYHASQRYQKTRAWFGWVQEAITTFIFILFIALGGFQLLDQSAYALGGANAWARGLCFAADYAIFRWILSLPFALYSTFVIEERFGFNKTTWKTYLSDQLKAVILGALLGGALFSGLVFFFGKTGNLAWIYAWVAVTAFQLFVQFLAPAVILPLFNRFEPLPEGELRRKIERYAEEQRFPLKELFTMDGSKRSTKANAFFTGFGKLRRLVLFDTLVQKQTPEELTAVVAHEIGHFKCRHIPKFTALSILSTGALFYILSRLLNKPPLFDAFRMTTPSVYASIILVGILLGPIGRLLSLFTHFYSRKFEYEADRFAARTYGHAELLVSALKKLSADSFSQLTPHPFKVLLDYTHPPVLQRIHALRALSARNKHP